MGENAGEKGHKPEDFGELQLSYFVNQFEVMLWTLISSGKVTKSELESTYSVDDVLKLAALIKMGDDTMAISTAISNEKIKEKQGNRKR